MLANQSCSNSMPETQSIGLDRSEISQLEADKQGENISVMAEMSVLEHMETYWKFFFSKAERVPAEQLPREKVQLEKLVNVDGDQLRAAWLGHSSMLINIDGYTILTDPLFERRMSLVGPTMFNDELVLRIEELAHIDVVLISHDHYDHLNKFSLLKLVSRTGLFLVPSRVGERLLKWGVPKEKIVELGWWEEYPLDKNLTIAATPAQHFSGRGLTDRNKTLWASWVILTPEHRVFFSGDSGYFNGFREIGKKYGPFDITFIECGAYNERWPDVHMFPEQTVQAHQDLRGKFLQPIHWATFNLSMHTWYEPIERLIAEAWKEGVKLSVPFAGQVVDYHNVNVTDLWWQPAMQRSLSRRDKEEKFCMRSKRVEESR